MDAEARAKGKAAMVAFLKTGSKWQKLATKMPGALIVWVPGKKDGSTPPYLSCALNPVDAAGTQTKKNGYFLRGTAQVDPIVELLVEGDYTINKRLQVLLDLVDEVNTEVNGTIAMPVMPVIEI